MAGVAGKSGTNKGKDKPWQDALRLAVMEDAGDGFKKLRKIAESCVAAAMSGDMQAIKEIGDRLDGKPAQAIIGGDENDPPVMIATTSAALNEAARRIGYVLFNMPDPKKEVT